MLQRLVEDFEYANLLDHAATLTNPNEQMAHVAAFTVSSYSTTAYRTGKPFNPLLGETYECDRTADLGWRCISEQVLYLLLVINSILYLLLAVNKFFKHFILDIVENIDNLPLRQRIL